MFLPEMSAFQVGESVNEVFKDMKEQFSKFTRQKLQKKLSPLVFSTLPFGSFARYTHSVLSYSFHWSFFMNSGAAEQAKLVWRLGSPRLFMFLRHGPTIPSRITEFL